MQKDGSGARAEREVPCLGEIEGGHLSDMGVQLAPEDAVVVDHLAFLHDAIVVEGDKQILYVPDAFGVSGAGAPAGSGSGSED